ncbi:MFS transporter [Janibacter sp. Soil728]|uniref:MFS transporter n=1 Tax=Janibacter sp. Soil728 TaxID=1736393 RepID=UPI001910FE65|nr:aromatic acid/H+ symport family MFS transporter [Janibacter sp. Soil728]
MPRPFRSAPSAGTSARLVLVLCALSIVFEGYDMVAYGVTLPAMLEDPAWGLSTEYAGVVGSYALVGMLAGSITVGAIADIIGRRWLMIGATAWYSAWTGVCAVAPDATLFGFARFMVGFGVGALIPLAAAMAVEFAPKGRAHTHSAIVWAGYPAGGVLASLLGLWVIDAFGPRAMYAIGTIPLIVFVPLMLRHLPESPSFLLARGRHDEAYAVADAAGIDRPLPPLAEERSGPRGLFTRGLWVTTVLMGLLSACGLMLTYGLNTWLPKIMESTGFGASSALGFLLALNAGAILVPLVVSRASDRIGAQIVTAGTLAAAAVAIIMLSTDSPIAFLYVMAFVAGAGTIGAQVLIYGFAAASFPASCRAAGTAWTASVGRIGGIVGPTLTGLVIAGGSVAPAFYMFAGVACVGAVVSLLVPRRKAVAARVPSEPAVAVVETGR